MSDRGHGGKQLEHLHDCVPGKVFTLKEDVEKIIGLDLCRQFGSTGTICTSGRELNWSSAAVLSRASPSMAVICLTLSL